jgi:hypothetical protein
MLELICANRLDAALTAPTRFWICPCPALICCWSWPTFAALARECVTRAAAITTAMRAAQAARVYRLEEMSMESGAVFDPG